MAELEIKPTPRQRLRVLSILLIANALSLFLMYLLVGGGRDLLASRTHLTSYMPDAGGLSLESEVRLSGIRIGKVDKIELSGILDPRRSVRVEMRVLTRYLKAIPDDSQTNITADTLVGYPFVDIAEGKSPIPIKPDGMLLSEPVKEAQDRADLIKTIRNELTQVDQIFANLEDPNSPVGAFIHGQKEYDAAVERVRGFDESLHSFLNPQSDLGKTFYTNKFYEQLRGKATAVDKTLASMQAGEGSVGHLYASDQAYNDLVRELADLRALIADLNAGKGNFSATLRDDAAWIKARQLLRQIDQTVAALNAGEGTAGRLLSNAQVYESLNGSLRSMEALLHDFRENPRKFLRLKPF